MKAVNLLPPELRGAPKAAAAAPPVSGDGAGAFVVLGVLAACAIALAGYVLTNNTIASRQAELAAATQREAAVARVSAQLKPYADFESLVSARIQTVRDLATSRFDWEQALRDLSRAIPSDVTLTKLVGTVSATAGGGGSNPLRAALDVPAIELSGCAHNQTAVAAMMARVRSVDGVTRVSLSKSSKDAVITSTVPGIGGVSYPTCGKGNPPTFEAVAFFERAGAAGVAPTGAAATTTTTTAATTPAGAAPAATPAAPTGATTPATGTPAAATGAPSTPVSTGGAK